MEYRFDVKDNVMYYYNLKVRRQISDLLAIWCLEAKSTMAYNLFQSNNDAEAYNTYMLKHPETLFDAIEAFCNSSIFSQESSGFDLAVDLGCGDGNSTFPLCKHYKKVIGIDISEALIHKATSDIPDEENVTFKVGAAEDLDFLNDSSVDLVTIGMAIHWMDKERLNNSIRRVLKTGGSVAAYGFSKITLDNDLADDYVNKLYANTVIPATGLPKERALLKTDFELPFRKMTRQEEIAVTKNWSIGRFIEFFKSSLSPNRTMLQMYPDTTIYDEMKEKLSGLYGDRKQEVPCVTFTYSLLLSRKPSGYN